MFNNIVTIQKKDKYTEEIKETIESKNSQTLGSLRNFFTGTNISDVILTDSYDSGSPRMFIQLKEMDLENVVNEATSNARSAPGTTYNTSQITGINQPIVTVDTTSKFVEYEFNGRLSPPSSGTRSITSAQLGIGESDGGQFSPGFAVILSTACTQDDTEILDIFYRVRISSSSKTTNDFDWITWIPLKLYGDEIYQSNGVLLADPSQSSNILGPTILSSYGKPPNKKMPVSTKKGPTGGEGNPSWSNYNITQLTAVRDFSYGLNDQVGRTYNTLHFFTHIDSYGSPENQMGYVSTSSSGTYQLSHQLLPDDINPLQGQFLHASDAVRPYLDPSFLGTGQGDITFDATNWNEDESVQYRLKFTTAGDVGTAEYKLYKKIVFGYIQNEYIHEIWSAKDLLVLPSQRMFNSGIFNRQTFNKPGDFWVEDDVDLLHFFDDNFDNALMPNVIDYNEKEIISFNTTGLSIINVFKDDFFNIDADSTPSLTTSEINDVVVNKLNGEIWVATTDAGLFRISSDFSTVTPITVGTASINENICYSVDYKNNGDIWAAFSGGLALSTDNGSTWTEFNETTTPEFLFTGISDGNWNQIQGIVVDKDSSDDRLLISKQGTKATSNIIWWSRAGSTTSSDAVDSTVPVNSQEGNAGLEGEIHTNSQAYGVSKWIKYFPGSNGTFILLNAYSDFTERGSNTEIRIIDFGATTLRASDDWNSASSDQPKVRFLSFEQDSSGNYGFLTEYVGGSSTNQEFNMSLYDLDLVELERLTNYDWGANGVPVGQYSDINEGNETQFYPVYLGRGIAVCCSGTDVNKVSRIIQDSDPFGDSTFNSIRDIMWEEYGWDGANWVLGNPNSKPVHSTQEPLIDDLEVQFTDVSSPNFVLDEYVDMFVFKGIHNDNATEFDFSVPVTVRPSQILSDFEQASVPASTFGAITNKELNFITNTGLNSTSSERIYQANGIVGTWMQSADFSGDVINDNVDHIVFSEIVFEGDFSISFKTTKDGRDVANAFSSIGVLPLASKGSATDYFSPSYLFQFNRQNYSVHSGTLGTNTQVVSDTAISAKSDVYTIERVGTDLNFKINGTTIHTFTSVSTNPFIVQAGFVNESFRTFYDMNIDSYTDNNYIVELGSSTTPSGVFDPDFAMIEAYLTPTTAKITLDGVDAPVNIDPHVDPAAGSVTLYSKSGYLKFNSADSGKTIGGSYQVLYRFS